MIRAFVAIVVLLAPLSAHAHGRPPVISAIRVVPGAPDRIVARGTWGFVTSDDGGQTWAWICAAAYGADATVEDPDYLTTSDGAVLVGTFAGLQRSRVDRCEWTPPDEALVGAWAIDLDHRPAEPDTIFAVRTEGSAPDTLLVSFDAGQSFSEVGPAIEDVLIERVRVAPSDPMRVYLSGAQPISADNPSRRAFFYRSDDGGQTRTVTEVPLVDEERNIHLLAVDPSDPDRVFLRMTRRPIDVRPERLLLSEDGGATFDSVLEVQTVSGVVFSEDGSTLWASARRGENADEGPPIGLWRSDDGGRSWEMLSGRDIPCVERRGDELWICLEELAHGYSIGRSTNGGESFEEVLRFDQIRELPLCDPCSRVGFVCPGWFPDLAFDLQLDGGPSGLPDGSVTGAPRDAAPPTTCGDGSVTLDAGMGSGGDGCGCAVRPRSATPGAALLLVALVWMRRRRIDRGTTRSVH